MYLLTNRKLKGIGGVAHLGGMCGFYENAGLSKFFTRGTQNWNDENTVNIMAHEIAHLFGAQHSGPECPISPGFMGQMKYRNFTKCALKQMNTHLHNVYEDEKRPVSQCLENTEATTSSNYRISVDNLLRFSLKNPCKYRYVQ